MKTLLPVILEELAQGRPVALATVALSKGSAPRGAGACMLRCGDGRLLGTVGGGVLEHRAQEELHSLLQEIAADSTVPPGLLLTVGHSYAAQALTGNARSFLGEYALTQDDVQSLGMVCGGNVSILYQTLLPDLLPFFREMSQQLAKGGSLWLMRELSRGRVVRMELTDGQAENAPTAHADRLRHCGRKAVCLPLAAGSSSFPMEDYACLIEPLALNTHAYLFGGGHVAQCVAPLLAQLDFAPVVYDDRIEFASEERFPTAAGVVCAPFREASRRLSLTPEDEIVIMTRGHANDLDILAYALRTPAYYIGLIGSRSKIAYTRAMLLSQGFTEEDFQRVHTPIGLPILAETPMEIAVSVAAEMILCRAQRAAEAPETASGH